MKVIHLILCCVIALGTLSGQSDSAKTLKIIQKAKALQSQNKGDKAASVLNKAVAKYPDNLKIRNALVINSLSRERWSEAIPHLEYLKDNTDAPSAKVYFSLYTAYRNTDQPDLAIPNLDLALGLMPTGTAMYNEKLRERESYIFGINAKSNPVDFNPVRLSNAINSEKQESLPSIALDGTMIFTRKYGNQEDLYQSKLDSIGEFSKAMPLENINTPYNEGAHCISADGNILLVSVDDRKDSYGGFDLYYSSKVGGQWTTLKNMGANINSKSWDAQPSLSADGNTLYFSSERNGNANIFKSELINKKWSEAVALDTIINSKFNEGSPFIHPDGETLYFRSNGHIGMGDYDLFVSRLENGKWSKPTNMGYPINSESSEGALFVDIFGEKAYFTRDSGLNKNDIYSFDLPTEFKPKPVTFTSIQILDSETKKPVRATVTINALEEGSQYLLESDDQGYINQVLNTNQTYAINVSAIGYSFYSEHIDLIDEADLNKPYRYTVLINSIREATEVKQDSKPVVLRNIFFDSGSYTLLPRSDFEIQTLHNLLQNNQDITIRVIGHTDNVGGQEDNLLLSQNRAASVKQALVSKGISESRIEAIGRGETQPIDSNDTLQGRENNRRTEFVIIY